jgi:hypothetical protein
MLNLIKLLSDKTRTDQVDWSVGSRADSFIFSGTKASVTIQSVDRDGAPPYEIILMDGAGRIAFEWTTEPENGDPVEQAILDILEPMYRELNSRLGVKAQVFDSLEQDLLRGQGERGNS